MPFAEEQFFLVFASHNIPVRPLPVAAHLLGLAALGLLIGRTRVGLLLLGSGRAARWLSVIPVLWCLVGGSAACCWACRRTTT